jgi:hypothetical protein
MGVVSFSRGFPMGVLYPSAVTKDAFKTLKAMKLGNGVFQQASL